MELEKQTERESVLGFINLEIYNLNTEIETLERKRRILQDAKIILLGGGI